MLMLELWRQHAILAPSCPVLLLPSSMSDVAEELFTLLGTHSQVRAASCLFLQDTDDGMLPCCPGA
jgi:hypothetical protein